MLLLLKLFQLVMASTSSPIPPGKEEHYLWKIFLLNPSTEVILFNVVVLFRS